MDWITSLLYNDSVGHTLLVLGFTVAFGLWLGSIRLWGVSLGVGGVMFAGLAAARFGFRLNPETLEFVREFGLVLFVYAIGLQVGPGFFSSLRRQGLRLNALAVVVVLGGSTLAVAVASWFSVPVPVAVGLLTGAVTNTPSLGAAQQALQNIPGGGDASAVTLGYAIAYPFGIIGIISVLLILRAVFRIDARAEAEEFSRKQTARSAPPVMGDFEVTNVRLFGLTLAELSRQLGAGVVITRRLHEGAQALARPEDRLSKGDVLHAVGPQDQLDRLRDLVGRCSPVHLPEMPSELTLRRIVVTAKRAFGKSIEDLAIKEKYNIVISRMTRAGVEFTPPGHLKLQFGDRLTAVGTEGALEQLARDVGDSIQELDRPHIIPVFLGIALGVVLGSWPLTVGNMPAPVRLGLAGGPLVVAILVGRLGRLGPFLCHVPTPAKRLLSELGICLFLACVGLRSGERFFDALSEAQGYYWMALGLLMTIIPILVVGVVARLWFRLDYPTLCGVLTGSMTDPPALAYSNQLAGGDAPSVAYAAVYPLTMLLRVIVAQLLILLFV